MNKISASYRAECGSENECCVTLLFLGVMMYNAFLVALFSTIWCNIVAQALRFLKCLLHEQPHCNVTTKVSRSSTGLV